MNTSPPSGSSSLSVPTQRVVVEAQERLRHSSYPSHRGLRCRFREGVLTLEGRVSSYYVRQTACALVADIEGVECVVDRMEVSELEYIRA
jgi:osmotically-inducible protein OsmY